MKRASNKDRFTTCIIIAAIFIFSAVASILFPSFFYLWDRQIDDHLFRLRTVIERDLPVPRNIVQVVLDDAYLEKHSVPDWSRDIYAEIISGIKEYEPRMIVCDVLFKDALPEAMFEAQNRKLMAAGADSGNLYYPVVTRERNPLSGLTMPDRFVWKPIVKNKGKPQAARTFMMPFAELLYSARGLGCINIDPDADGMIRRYRLLYESDTGFIPSLALCIAAAYLGVDPNAVEIEWGKHLRLANAQFPGGLVKDVWIPIDESGSININFKGPWEDTNLNIQADMLTQAESDPDLRDELYTNMNDSIVIIANISTESKDYNPGIFEAMYPAVGILSTVADSILSEDHLRDTDVVTYILISLVMAALIFVVSLRSGAAAFTARSGILFILFLCFNLLMFFGLHTLPKPALPSSAFIAAAVLITVYKLVSAEKERVMLLERAVAERTRELSDANDTLADTNTRLEKAIGLKDAAIEQKTSFFHNLAHEIKTPLTLIRNYISSYRIAAGKSRELEIVEKNIDKLCMDVGNFFDAEKIAKGKMLYDHDQTADMSSIIEDAVILFRAVAKKKNLAIECSIAKDIYVQADPSAVDRIVFNLLDNAVKYTPENGEIGIDLSTNEISPILLRVSNDGPGIPEEQRARIFEPYFQLSGDKAASRGMGLGLPLVKEIVRQAGGDIRLECDGCTGITFIVDLPAAKTPAEKTGGVKTRRFVPAAIETAYFDADETRYSPEKQTILLVEDNVQLLTLLRSSFAPHYNVFCARHGSAAIDLLATKQKPDIIVSDIIMEGLDGFGLLREVEGNDQWKDIPFIFLTAKTEKEERMKGLAAGAIDFVAKPFAVEELSAKVKSILNQRKAQKESDIREIENKISRVLRAGESKAAESVLIDHDLNKTERKIIELLGLGLQYKEISERVNLSVAGVRKRVHAIYQEFNVQNRTELIREIEKRARGDGG